MSVLRPIGEGYASFMRHALAGLMAVLLVVMVMQVVARYAFNSSFIWAEELCRYLLIWVSFLGCGMAYARGELATVGLLGDALPPRASAALAVFANLCVGGLLVALMIYGWRYAERVGSRPIPALGFLFDDLFGPAAPTAPGLFWVYLAVPAGMALLLLHVLARTCVRLADLADRPSAETTR